VDKGVSSHCKPRPSTKCCISLILHAFNGIRVAEYKEHKEHAIKGFSERYNTIRLVYYEMAPSAYSAILREKQLKKWSRVKKDKLIDSVNPERRDLFIDLEKEY